MERVKRRWWTWAITLLAAIVIIGAVISGLFQLAVLALPSYRADLSAWVTHVANRPIQIGGVNLGWRGVEPRLDLTDITLFSEDGDESLTLDRLSLGFSLPRLLIGDMLPRRLEVSGLTLEIEEDAQGSWSIAGFRPGEAGMSQQTREEWARQAARFSHMVVKNCRLQFNGPRFGPAGQQVRVVRVDLDQSRNGFGLDGRAQLPATHGDLVELSAKIYGPLVDPRAWAGDFELDFERLQPQGWLAPYLQPGVQIGAENLNGSLEGQLRDGRMSRARLDVDSDGLIVASKGQSSGAKAMHLRADLSSDARGWLAELKELRFDDQQLARASVRWMDDAAGREIDLSADQLALGRLTPWLAVWRGLPAASAAAPRLSGTVRNLVLRLRSDHGAALRYSATGRFENLALAPDGQIGISQLTGQASATEDGGQLRLSETPLLLELPGKLSRPLAFDAVSAQLQWTRAADAWRVSSPAFNWTVAASSGNGHFQLQLPSQAAASPELDLSARFAVPDITTLKAYMPQVWPESLRDWLERGFIAGRVPRGELTLRGPLADFPFVKHPDGVFKVDADLSGVDLAYAKDWPTLTDIAAHLSVTGSSLKLNATAADLSGNRVERALLRIDDFAEAVIDLDASSSGEIGRYYGFLQASPLQAQLSGLLDQTRAAGNARVDLRLLLPLHDHAATAVNGEVALDNVQMFYTRLDAPFSGLSGTIGFDRHGIFGDGLSARFEDLPLAVRIEPRAGTHGVVIADFPFTPNADGVGASHFLPELLRRSLDGSSRWRAELPLNEQGGTAVTLSTDLLGTAVHLPEPLAKPAESPLPLSLRIGSDAAAPLRIVVAYAQRIAADLALAGGDAGLALQGLRARFGAAAAPAAKNGSYVVDGRAGTLDLGAWASLFGGSSTGPDAAARPAGEAAPKTNAVHLDLIDLDVDHLRWQQLLTGATHLRWQPSAAGWHATLAGEGAQGVVDWNGPAPGSVVARLDQLALSWPPPQKPAAGTGPAPPAADAQSPPARPVQWPELDLLCDSLNVKGTDFSRLELHSTRIADGQRLDRLKTSGGVLDLNAVGQWRRIDGRSSADLRTTLDSDDFAAVLRAFDYEQNFRARKTHFKADLKWPQSPAGLVWQAAGGRVELSAEDGQLRALKPGAGRVLGLLNFYALPRRLTLDFSDVVDKGLGFDHIDGHFDLGNGVARSDDLTIEGPSVKIAMRGRIGLIARDYDQKVTVYPAGVSSGVTLGAALLGGPAVGALVLLAQEVLDKPLDQVTQLSYHVTGSWDNPKVEKIDAAAVRATETRKK